MHWFKSDQYSTSSFLRYNTMTASWRGLNLMVCSKDFLVNSLICFISDRKTDPLQLIDLYEARTKDLPLVPCVGRVCDVVLIHSDCDCLDFCRGKWRNVDHILLWLFCVCLLFRKQFCQSYGIHYVISPAFDFLRGFRLLFRCELSSWSRNDSPLDFRRFLGWRYKTSMVQDSCHQF